jgi:hypothetical protein
MMFFILLKSPGSLIILQQGQCWMDTIAHHKSVNFSSEMVNFVREMSQNLGSTVQVLTDLRVFFKYSL